MYNIRLQFFKNNNLRYNKNIYHKHIDKCNNNIKRGIYNIKKIRTKIKIRFYKNIQSNQIVRKNKINFIYIF